MHSIQTQSALSDATFLSCNLYIDKLNKLPVPQSGRDDTFSNTAWSSNCWRGKLHYWYLIQVCRREVSGGYYQRSSKELSISELLL